MNATVLERSASLSRTRPALAVFAVAALLALALAALLDTGSTASPAAVTTPMSAPAVDAGSVDPRSTPAASPAPEAQAPRRPARRHRQPLSMPFFSFAARS